MKRIFELTLLLAALALGACAPRAERTVRVEHIGPVTFHGLSGVEVQVRVHNGTARKIGVREGSLTLFYDAKRAVRLTLRDEAIVARRSTQELPVRLHMKLYDPLSAAALIAALQRGELSGVGIALEARVRAGIAGRKIVVERMPLSDFLRNFGLSLDQLKEFIE